MMEESSTGTWRRLNAPSRVSARETRWWIDEDESLQTGCATQHGKANQVKSYGVPKMGNEQLRCPWIKTEKRGKALYGENLEKLVGEVLRDLGRSRQTKNRRGNDWRDDVACRVSERSDA